MYAASGRATFCAWTTAFLRIDETTGRLVEWLYTRTPVYAWELPGKWYDIGTPEQLEAARAEFATESAR